MSSRRVNPRLILFVTVSLLVAAAAWRARDALTPFVFGLSIAYLLAPVVQRVENRMPRRRWARPAAIGIVYLLAIALLAAVLAVMLPPLLREAQALVEGAPDFFTRLEQRVAEFMRESYAYWPPEVRTAIEDAVSSANLQRLALPLLDTARRALVSGVAAITDTAGFLLGFLIIPIWLFYVLNDATGVLRGAMGLVPSDLRPDAEAIRLIVDRVLSAYIRGQLVIAVIYGTLFTIALILLGVPYSVLLGLFAGLLAIIPIVGTFVGTATAVFVAFLTSSALAVKTFLAFMLVQQVGDYFISPRVQGRAVALSPPLVMLVILAGPHLIGPLGLVLAVPLTAILRDIVHYTYLRVGTSPAGPAKALTDVGYGDRVNEVVRGEPSPGTTPPRSESRRGPPAELEREKKL